MRTYDEAYAAAKDQPAFSNGTEGYAWTGTWCDTCLHDRGARDGTDPKRRPSMWIRKRTYYATLHAKDVIIQRLHDELAELHAAPAYGSWEYFAALAFAYVDAPEGTDDVDAAWHELASAVNHWRARGGQEPRDPDLLFAGVVLDRKERR